MASHGRGNGLERAYHRYTGGLLLLFSMQLRRMRTTDVSLKMEISRIVATS